ncbi:tRNA (guanosine(37)-N1)-methyltransferase TrmD [Candidatus Spongiihabitans sp.]|uniref:tRNA (guanosine(37)-N1)-methyltransferase TrmD n=1 Tax=Candidatus Spongiihabitans sp. TaxID=3101308 RepID=UPI003C6F0399
MEINVISIFPTMFDAVLEFGITRQAIEKGLLKLVLWNPRDYTEDQHRTVDDRPYGGGPGMLMKPEPLARCIDDARVSNSGPVVYLSPQGDLLNQQLVEELADYAGLTLLAGRYEGIDERVIESRVDREVSIGDYVLAGGEIPAMTVIDAIARLLPSVLGNDLSARQDSFSNGLLDCPHYTRPECFEGLNVPQVLLNGDHEKIRQWRLNQSIAKTGEHRPDLLERVNLEAGEFRY